MRFPINKLSEKFHSLLWTQVFFFVECWVAAKAELKAHSISGLIWFFGFIVTSVKWGSCVIAETNDGSMSLLDYIYLEQCSSAKILQKKNRGSWYLIHDNENECMNGFLNWYTFILIQTCYKIWGLTSSVIFH